jgi:hypothetical protein
MKLERLTREALARKSRNRIATISFTRRGVVILSNVALVRLNVRHGSLVDVFQGDVPSEFYIAVGNTYRLRKNGTGGAVFNSVDLAQLVMDKTWAITPRPAGAMCPDRFTFIVCERPVDDEENKEIYALLRKKT